MARFAPVDTPLGTGGTHDAAVGDVWHLLYSSLDESSGITVAERHAIVERAERLGDPRLIGAARIGLTFSLFRSQAYEQNNQNAFETLRYVDKLQHGLINDAFLAMLFNNLGRLAMDRDEVEAAVYWHDRSVQSSREANDLNLEQTGLSNLIDAKMARGDLDDVLALLEEFWQRPFLTTVAASTILNVLGVVAAESGNTTLAASCTEAAHKREPETSNYWASIAHNRICLELMRGNVDEAIALCDTFQQNRELSTWARKELVLTRGQLAVLVDDVDAVTACLEELDDCDTSLWQEARHNLLRAVADCDEAMMCTWATRLLARSMEPARLSYLSQAVGLAVATRSSCKGVEKPHPTPRRRSVSSRIAGSARFHRLVAMAVHLIKHDTIGDEFNVTKNEVQASEYQYRQLRTTLTHDLRRPLTLLQLAVESGSLSNAGGEVRAARLERAHDVYDQLAFLVESTLLVAELSAGYASRPHHTGRLGGLVDGAIATAGPWLRQNQQTMRFCSRDQELHGDMDTLLLILRLLAVHSACYSVPGVSLRITLDAEGLVIGGGMGSLVRVQAADIASPHVASWRPPFNSQSIGYNGLYLASQLAALSGLAVSFDPAGPEIRLRLRPGEQWR